jgi:quercetin dioxygenase-like cupin family protein
MRIVRAAEITAGPTDTAKWTSQVWRADILRTDDGGLRSNRFVYAPGHRSNWHVHEGEQALIVLSGRGLILWQGRDAAELLGPGDWVHVSPGVPHWHGAVPDDTFEHLAVTATGGTVWQGPVDDPAYRSALPRDVGAR